MLQQIVVTTSNQNTLRSLLRAAIETELKTLAFGLERTRKRLAGFEQKFGMASTEFEQRLNRGELAETLDHTDWRMELGMLRLLEEHMALLQEAHLD